MDKSKALEISKEMQAAINAAAPSELAAYREMVKDWSDTLKALGWSFKFEFPDDALPEPPAPEKPKDPPSEPLDEGKMRAVFGSRFNDNHKRLLAEWDKLGPVRRERLKSELSALVTRHEWEVKSLLGNTWNLSGFAPKATEPKAIRAAFDAAAGAVESVWNLDDKLDAVKAGLTSAYRALAPQLQDARTQLAKLRRELEVNLGSERFSDTKDAVRAARLGRALGLLGVVGFDGEPLTDTKEIKAARQHSPEFIMGEGIAPHELYEIYNSLNDAFGLLDAAKNKAISAAGKAAFNSSRPPAAERKGLADQVERELRAVLRGEDLADPISTQGRAWMEGKTPPKTTKPKAEAKPEPKTEPKITPKAEPKTAPSNAQRRLEGGKTIPWVIGLDFHRSPEGFRAGKGSKPARQHYGHNPVIEEMMNAADRSGAKFVLVSRIYNASPKSGAIWPDTLVEGEGTLGSADLDLPSEDNGKLFKWAETAARRIKDALDPQDPEPTIKMHAAPDAKDTRGPRHYLEAALRKLGVKVAPDVGDAWPHLARKNGQWDEAALLASYYQNGRAPRSWKPEPGDMVLWRRGYSGGDREVIVDEVERAKEQSALVRYEVKVHHIGKDGITYKATVPDSQLHPIEGNPKGEVLVKAPEPPKPKEGDKVLVYTSPSEPPHLGTVGKFWTSKGYALGVEYIGRKGEPLPAIYSEVVKPFDPAVRVRSIFAQFDKPKSQVTVNGPALKVALDLVVPLAKARSKHRDSRPENILFESKGDRLWVTATDLATQVSQSIPAKGDEWSALVAYGKTFDALLTRMDESPEVTIGFSPFVAKEAFDPKADNNECVIQFSFGRAMSKLPRNNCLTAWDASVWATRTAPDSAGEVVDAEVMAEAMKRTAKALKTLDRSEDRAKYSGSFLVTATGEGYTFLGTDGFKITKTQMRHAGVGLLNQLAIESNVPNVYLDGAWDKKVHIQTEDMPGGQRKKVFFSDGDTVVSTLANVEKDGANALWDEIKRVAGGESSTGWLEVERAELVSVLKLLNRRNDAANKEQFGNSADVHGVMLGAVNSNLHLIMGFTDTEAMGSRGKDKAFVAENVPASGDGTIFAYVNKSHLLEILGAMKDRRVMLGSSNAGGANLLWLKGEEGVHALAGLLRDDIRKDRNGKQLPPERKPHVYGAWTDRGRKVSEEELALRVVALSESGQDISETDASHTPGKQTLTPSRESDMKKGNKKASASQKAAQQRNTEQYKAGVKAAEDEEARKRNTEQYKAGVKAAEDEAERQRALKYNAAMESYERDMEQKRAEAVAMLERAKASKAKPKAKDNNERRNANVEARGGKLYITDPSLGGVMLPYALRQEGFAWDHEVGHSGAWVGPDNAKTRALLAKGGNGWTFAWAKPMPEKPASKPAPMPEPKGDPKDTMKAEGKPKNPNVIKVTPKGGELRITDTYPLPYPVRQARKAEGFVWDGDARCWIGPDNAKTRGACEGWGLKVGGEVLARDLVGKMGGGAKAEPKATPKADTKPKAEPQKTDKGGIVETVKEAAAGIVEAVMGKPDKPKDTKKDGGKPKAPKSSRPVKLPRSWAQLECMSGAELRRVYPSALGKDASDNAKPAALRQEIAAALGITPPESCSHDRRVTVNLTTEARAKLAEGGGSVSGKIRDVLVKQGIEKRCKKRERRCGKGKKAA